MSKNFNIADLMKNFQIGNANQVSSKGQTNSASQTHFASGCDCQNLYEASDSDVQFNGLFEADGCGRCSARDRVVGYITERVTNRSGSEAFIKSKLGFTQQNMQEDETQYDNAGRITYFEEKHGWECRHTQYDNYRINYMDNGDVWVRKQTGNDETTRQDFIYELIKKPCPKPEPTPCPCPKPEPTPCPCPEPELPADISNNGIIDIGGNDAYVENNFGIIDTDGDDTYIKNFIVNNFFTVNNYGKKDDPTPPDPPTPDPDPPTPEKSTTANLMPLKSVLAVLKMGSAGGKISTEIVDAALNNPTLADMDGDTTSVSSQEAAILNRIKDIIADKELYDNICKGNYDEIPEETLQELDEMSRTIENMKKT